MPGSTASLLIGITTFYGVSALRHIIVGGCTPIVMPGVILSDILFSSGALSTQSLSDIFSFVHSPIGIELVVQCCIAVHSERLSSTWPLIVRSSGARLRAKCLTGQ